VVTGKSLSKTPADDSKQAAASLAETLAHASSGAAVPCAVRKLTLPPSDVVHCSIPAESVEITALVTAEVPFIEDGDHSRALLSIDALARQCLVIPFTKHEDQPGTFTLSAYLFSAVPQPVRVDRRFAEAVSFTFAALSSDPVGLRVELSEVVSYHQMVERSVVLRPSGPGSVLSTVPRAMLQSAAPVPSSPHTGALFRYDMQDAWSRSLDTVGGPFPGAETWTRNPHYVLSVPAHTGTSPSDTTHRPVRVAVALICDQLLPRARVKTGKQQAGAAAGGDRKYRSAAQRAANAASDITLSVWKYSARGSALKLAPGSSPSAATSSSTASSATGDAGSWVKHHLLQATDLVALSEFGGSASVRAYEALLRQQASNEDDVPFRIVYCDMLLPATSSSEFVLVPTAPKGIEGFFRLAVLADAPYDHVPASASVGVIACVVTVIVCLTRCPG